ncbi:hypothetical protein GWK16_10625 [Roseomonas sp. JC162]|uniref:DUF3757 domain-containing protein n=1 Tax=Neoroseomonas marina TaxID=1232220 RepID=A0A848EDW7_9PROT|nr:hypothetical protein [Neoroseomonas marina]
MTSVFHRAHACAGPAAAVMIALSVPVPALADCLDWQSPAVVTEQGLIRGLPSGALRWRIGRRAADGAHLQTAVEIRWTGPDGRERQQALFGEIQDGRALLSGRNGRLDLRVTYCTSDSACRDTTLPFTWDRAAGHFVGGSPAAREVLARACQPEPTERPTR